MSTVERPRFQVPQTGSPRPTPPFFVVDTPWLPPITKDMLPDEYVLPTQDDLPCEDGAMHNSFDSPQSTLLKQTIWPTLLRLHRDEPFAVVHDVGFYLRTTTKRRSTGISPDWAYVPGVSVVRENGEMRRSFLAWEEDITPVVALEYLSFTGGGERDRTPETGKFWWYERWLKPKYYGIYDVDGGQLEMYRHDGDEFQLMEPNESGRYRIEPLDLELGIWHGEFQGMNIPWMRWYTPDGTLLPTGDERAEAERQRNATLAAKLRELGIDPDTL